jgi:hypothetical protein
MTRIRFKTLRKLIWWKTMLFQYKHTRIQGAFYLIISLRDSLFNQLLRSYGIDCSIKINTCSSMECYIGKDKEILASRKQGVHCKKIKHCASCKHVQRQLGLSDTWNGAWKSDFPSALFVIYFQYLKILQVWTKIIIFLVMKTFERKNWFFGHKIHILP